MWCYKPPAAAFIFEEEGRGKADRLTESKLKGYTIKCWGVSIEFCISLLGEKPWQCETCPKAFLHKDTYKAHIRRHKGKQALGILPVAIFHFFLLWLKRKTSGYFSPLFFPPLFLFRRKTLQMWILQQSIYGNMGFEKAQAPPYGKMRFILKIRLSFSTKCYLYWRLKFRCISCFAWVYFRPKALSNYYLKANLIFF